jgi:hypothetical protein
MGSRGTTGERLIALFILACALFNYPLLWLFNVPGTLFGIPVLYVYVFVAWGTVIGLLAWIMERHRDD